MNRKGEQKGTEKCAEAIEKVKSYKVEGFLGRVNNACAECNHSSVAFRKYINMRKHVSKTNINCCPLT